MFDAEYKLLSSEYMAVNSISNEDFALVGNIGYYYAARAWMGRSGKLYATRQYDDKAYVFSSIFDLIETVMIRKRA